MADDDDQFTAVLVGAQGGDATMLGELWRRHQPRLLAYLRACDGPAAEDLASDTWLSVARSLSTFAGNEDDFRRWLFTVGRRRLIDRRRRSMRRPEELVRDQAARVDSTGDPAHVATDVSNTNAAIALIRTLPADQAEVVLLRVIADLDVATVATVLGKSEGAVRVHCHRGLRRLAERLAADSPNNLVVGVTEAPPAAIT